MKMKFLAMLTAVLAALSMTAAASPEKYTLIVSPARYSVIQVMFDVIARHPSVLVSYEEVEDGDVLLHVWNGRSWDEIDLHDLGELNFLPGTPSRVIMVGNDDLLPARVRDALAWMSNVDTVRQLDNASLLNDFGRIQKWKSSEWKWFAARYNLNLEDEASEMRKSSWYDRRGPIPKDDVEYSPVPVLEQGATINPSSSPLPEPVRLDRPSDLPDAPAMTPEADAGAAAVKENAETTVDRDAEIQEIVNTLNDALAEETP